MTENSLVNDPGTDPQDNSENQAPATRTYTQKEVDDMMARTKTAVTKRVLSKYEDLGDPEELRQLKSEAEKRAQEQQLKRGEFERTLQEKAAKWEAEIAKRDSVIKEYKVHTPVLNAAAKYRAVNPDQVRTLLQPSLRLNSDGDVEIVDHSGAVRYRDNGTPLAVEDLVREFLDSNPHFVSASPATTNTQSSVGRTVTDNTVDITKLDFKNPEHRKVYAQYRKTVGLA